MSRVTIVPGPTFELNPADAAVLTAAMPPGTRATTAQVVADRLDLLGHTARHAWRALEEELALTSTAMEGLDARLGNGNALVEAALDASGWLQRVSGADPDRIDALLALVADCDPVLLVRACLLALPRSVVELEQDPHAFPVTPTPRLVLSGTEAEAEELREALERTRPHLSDLILITHLQHLDADTDVTQMLERFGVGGSAGEALVELAAKPDQEPRQQA